MAAYEAERRPVVTSTQRAAHASLRWFEEPARYVDQPPYRFAFNLLTRSRRVTHANLRLRDPEFVAEVEREAGVPEGTPAMFTPFDLGPLTLRNRVVVSPMDMCRAVDGVPGDSHLVHLGGRALGGAGLVMTEMVCVSALGRITPGCTGLWNEQQEAGWRRIVDFVHHQSPGTALGVQLGHAGRKGFTRLMWEGIDQPLQNGNWPLVAPSPLPCLPGVSQSPCELDRRGLTEIRDQFTAAARRAARAEFDLLELHCAHGYLLSGFLSALTNLRTDAYGGDLTSRLRYPLEVFDAVREVWPSTRPLTVRISATDWAPGGTTAADAVRIASAFAEHGADAVDVSTGQVLADEQPDFGRSYQAPYADRIRNEAGVPVIAVGAISSWDDVNSLILAGRADLCALARPHLYDPRCTPARRRRAGVQRTRRPLAAPVRRGKPPTADRPHRGPQTAVEPVAGAPEAEGSRRRDAPGAGHCVGAREARAGRGVPGEVCRARCPRPSGAPEAGRAPASRVLGRTGESVARGGPGVQGVREASRTLESLRRSVAPAEAFAVVAAQLLLPQQLVERRFLSGPGRWLRRPPARRVLPGRVARWAVADRGPSAVGRLSSGRALLRSGRAGAGRARAGRLRLRRVPAGGVRRTGVAARRLRIVRRGLGRQQTAGWPVDRASTVWRGTAVRARPRGAVAVRPAVGAAVRPAAARGPVASASRAGLVPPVVVLVPAIGGDGGDRRNDRRHHAHRHRERDGEETHEG